MTTMNRRRFIMQSAAAGAALAVSPILRAAGVNEQLNLGFIGLGGRGSELLKNFAELPNVRISALCDVDQESLDKAAQNRTDAKKYADLRKLLDDKEVDAVVIATCNHWHVLAAIWACQAGKHVYLEKPVAHNHWEGQQLVKAARKHHSIVQVGTQQRSDPMQVELKEFLHKNQSLGKINYAEVCRYGKRASIGKRSSPLTPPASVDYNLWLGPAADQPIFRDKLHYDWHWDWNTGNGEQGNWGAHVVDDVVNVVLLDKVPFPKRIVAGAGRVIWDDAGNTPNVSFVSYDTGATPVIFGLTNLPLRKGSDADLEVDGVSTGYVVHCEGGYYAGIRGGGVAYDRTGKEIKRFKGDSGLGHPKNFVDAVSNHDRSRLNCEVETGHRATAWCNLANVACKMGGPYSHASSVASAQNLPAWTALVERLEKQIAENGAEIANSGLKLSPILTFDTATEQFTGEHAAEANKFLRRQYTRTTFAVAEIT